MENSLFVYLIILSISSTLLYPFYFLLGGKNKKQKQHPLDIETPLTLRFYFHNIASGYYVNILSRKQFSLARCNLGSHLEMTSKFTFSYPLTSLFSHLFQIVTLLQKKAQFMSVVT